MKTAIIIPAYNEEKSIGKIIQQAKRFGDVIVVNDNSKDATEEVAYSNGAILLSHSMNRGYAGGLDSGFIRAKELGYTHAITMDADGQHPVEILENFIRAFEEGYDLVLGVRDRHQRISESVFSKYTKRRFGIADPLCGLKGYSMKLSMVNQFCPGGFVGTELALRSVASGTKFKEICFVSPERLHGQSRFSSSAKANLKIFVALLRVFFIQSSGHHQQQ